METECKLEMIRDWENRENKKLMVYEYRVFIQGNEKV